MFYMISLTQERIQVPRYDYKITDYILLTALLFHAEYMSIIFLSVIYICIIVYICQAANLRGYRTSTNP